MSFCYLIINVGPFTWAAMLMILGIMHLGGKMSTNANFSSLCRVVNTEGESEGIPVTSDVEKNLTSCCAAYS